MKPPRPAESGLTLMELVVSVGLFLLVGVAMTELFDVSSDAHRTGVSIAVLEGRCQRAVEVMADDLMQAGVSTLVPVPVPPFGATELDFQQPAGWDPDTGAVVWGPVLGFALESEPGDPEDGADNDGDGVVDEHQVVRRVDVGGPDERSAVLVTGVAPRLEGEVPNGVDDNGNGLTDEEGLCFSLVEEGLEIRLTVVGRDAGGNLLLRTVMTAVAPRN